MISGLLMVVGCLLFVIGYIWIIITAILTGRSTGEKVIWALVNVICQPITGIIFVIVRRQGVIPLIMIILGVIITNVGVVSDPEVMREVLKMAR